jgi:DNA repair exonuclease SbcCD ATPase subunit
MDDYSNYNNYTKSNTTKEELLKLLKNDKEVNEMVGNIFSKLLKKFMPKEKSNGNDCKKYEEKNQNLKKINNQLIADKTNLQNQIVSYKNQTQELKKINNQLIADKTNLQNQIADYKNKNRKLENDYTGKISQLQKEITDYKFRLDYQQNELRKKETAHNNLEIKVKNLQKIKDKYNSTASKFEKLLTIHKTYLSIQKEHGTFLKSLFKSESIEVFFANGVQDTTIDALWDYIKDAIIEGKNRIEELKQIFFYFFEFFNKTYNSPLFEFSKVEEGDKFSDNLHIKVNDYAYSGNITKIVFKGYYNTNTEEIVKKTLVESH